ncbi:MAG TPA: hypothetical protein DEQ30_01535, partial [Porphyromonadaceae bacterium]|nr:hypothetical protein [Porphyromonadaceae bacterium]
MKFKSLFLTMLGAAAIVSCNNDVIGPDGGGPNGGPDTPLEGVDTYATIGLRKSPITYAGDTVISATTIEQNVVDAAMYVYRWDGANMTAEAMAYLPKANLTSPPDLVADHMTVKVKSGTKKIFMALNIANGSAADPLLPVDDFTTSVIDTGVPYTTQFTVLNNILESTTAAYEVTSSPTVAVSTTAGELRTAKGLIQTLAGGSINTAKGVLYSTQSLDSDAAFFMSNWDGPKDSITGTIPSAYTSDCLFVLLPNISAKNSKTTGDNHFIIGVQRAVAKVSLRITAAGATSSSTATAPYYTSEEDGSKGHFKPWTEGVSGPAIWTLGGINKRTTPFQTFGGTSSAVASPNYSLADTVHFSAIKGSEVADAVSIAWYSSYDNTRVYGTGHKYGTKLNTVDNVETAMKAAGNYLPLSTPDADGSTAKPFNTAFCTENGTAFPQWQSKGTYVIVGGEYTPKNVLTGINKPSVTTNPAEKGWNGSAPVANEANTGYDANTYPALSYETAGMDTLYYLVANKVFIHGSANLKKYYAWELKYDKDVDDPSSSSIVTNQINDAIDEGLMLAYSKARCFYRVWIKDPNAAVTSTYEDEVAVRRNHVYDINISKIKGPGIDDP